MSEVEFFELRPPKVAAIKLDFLNDPDREAAEKLMAMPGVDEVSIEYGRDGRSIMVNPHGPDDFKFRLSARYMGNTHWLVCKPPPLDSMAPGELMIVSDHKFNFLYRPSEVDADAAESVR